MAATDLDAMTKRRGFRIAHQRDREFQRRGRTRYARGAANWARLKRIDDYLAAHPDDPDLAEMREKLRLMKGVMYWRLSESFKARLWNERRSVKELEAELKETQKRAVLVKQAREACPPIPEGLPPEWRRGARAWINCNSGSRRVRQTESITCRTFAIRELEAQKQRIEIYQIQARYELAAIYDKTTDKASQPKPKAKP
jgi:hypothetical protein